MGEVAGLGGPCVFSVSPSPFGLNSLGLWTLDLGLTILLQGSMINREQRKLIAGLRLIPVNWMRIC